MTVSEACVRLGSPEKPLLKKELAAKIGVSPARVSQFVTREGGKLPELYEGRVHRLLNS